MKTVKCKLTEYRKTYYLLYEDGRTAKVGDRVLAPSVIALQTVTSFRTDFDKEGFAFLSSSGNASHLVSQLPVVVATHDEISMEDLGTLKKNPLCYIFENEGEAIKSDGEILISFEEINYAEFKAKSKI